MKATLSSRIESSKIVKALGNSNLIHLALGFYVLLVLAFTATSRAESLNSQNNAPKTTVSTQFQTYFGDVVSGFDGSILLISPEGETIELKSELDLYSYVGQTVRIIGKEMKHKVGPVFQTSSFNPLKKEESSMPVGSVVLVFAIHKM